MMDNFLTFDNWINKHDMSLASERITEDSKYLVLNIDESAPSVMTYQECMVFNNPEEAIDMIKYFILNLVVRNMAYEETERLDIADPIELMDAIGTISEEKVNVIKELYSLINTLEFDDMDLKLVRICAEFNNVMKYFGGYTYELFYYNNGRALLEKAASEYQLYRLDYVEKMEGFKNAFDTYDRFDEEIKNWLCVAVETLQFDY